MLEYEFRFRGKVHTLDYHSLTMDEWVAAERATGLHWAQLAQGIDARSATGLKTFLWLTLRRQQPSLGFSALTFTPTELEFEVHGEPEAGEGDGDPPPSDDSPSDP